jgi:hypothetical protein
MCRVSPEGQKMYHWRDDPSQKVWLWVGLLFLVFYFAEAVLFWGPEPRVVAPPFTPLVYWGLFGAALIWLVTRPVANAPTDRIEQVQSCLVGVVVTGAVVGTAFLVIARTQDVTAGHAVLMFSLAEAGLLIGLLSLKPGWIVAGLIWIAAGAWLLCQPKIQDYVLGAAVAVGFILVGIVRNSLVRDAS